jgi:PAS domain-containing protein
MRDPSLMTREALIEELRRIQTSEVILRTVTETAGIGLAIVGEDHRYRYTNQTYKTFLHLPPDDLA